MGLSKYKLKRSFNKTPEPTGGKASGKELRFVVQKHDASHLHYDFRLEMEGVLKSWAIPKGPSLDPEMKRLAMMVEDHPYDYRTFEGIIPEGNYGAGTVIVWDEGTYEPIESTDNKKEEEKILLRQLKQGSLKFILHGKKLKGEFALVKINSRGENAWLLIKHRDKYASANDITKKDKSVVSNKTLEQVEKTSKNFWGSNRKASTHTKSAKTKAAKKITKTASEEKTDDDIGEPDGDISLLLEKGKKSSFPHDIRPMLATVVDKPFDDEDWVYEIKWDGYRALAYLKNGKVDLRSRANLSYNEKFGMIAEALGNWKINALIDGEIIAVNKEGRPDFQALQGFAKTGNTANLFYYAFDLLWYDGKDYTQLPLVERKAILQSVMPEDEPLIKFSDHLVGEGKAFFAAAIEKGLEGVMAKKAGSVYTINYRTKSWLKIKNNQQTEAIICGFTKPRKSRKHFGALVLGKYEGDKLIYVGHTGSGFTEKTLKETYQKIEPLITDVCPFEKKPKTNMPVTWVKPQFVCEIKYAEWTSEGILRIPIFLGLREDKTAKDEKNEKVVSPPAKTTKRKQVSKQGIAKTKQLVYDNFAAPVKKKTATKTGKAERGTLLANDENEKIVTINKHELKFTNLNKIYWPDEKITKRDMLNYYYEVMPFILPYMKDRPQSLNRHPNGINGENFFQKNVQGKVADWITTYPYTSESDGGTKQFLVCADEAHLMYIASLGCIEMNPWHSRIQSPENPDWCVIDLDPDENPFHEVVECANVVKQVLDSINVPAYCKTSGATGMHIYIPLGTKYTYEQSKLLAQLIVQMVHQEIPSYTSVERNPAKRKKKIYLDFLQNRTIQTIAAPYSLRPKPGATVSTPLHWEEVKKGLSPKNFTIFNIRDRIKNEGDLFKPVLGKGIDLEKTLQKLSTLFEVEKQ
ncbi:MAG TPA: DNA ligase D [Chitinophagaceae bacterium]